MWKQIAMATVIVWMSVVQAQGQKPPRSASVKTIVAERVLSNVMSPGRLRVHNGTFYILSRADDAIIEVDDDLTIRRRIGQIGSGPGELYHPEDFDIARDGTFWFADRGNDRIQGLNAKGESIASFSVRSPSSVAALDGGDIAVVGIFDEAVIRLFRRNGEEVRTIGEVTPVPGATDRQSNYFNRVKLTAMPDGDVLAAFRFLIPPAARRYSPGGALKATYSPTSEHVASAVEQLKGRRLEDLKRKNLGGRVSMSGSTVDDSGHVWLAPSAVGVFRFAPDGRQLQEYRFTSGDGQPFGIHDMAFHGDRVIAISGAYIIAGKIPR